VGAAEAYRRLCNAEGPGLPVCYYLYSLEGALSDRDWRELTDDEKRDLRVRAGVRQPGRGSWRLPSAASPTSELHTASTPFRQAIPAEAIGVNES